MGIVWVGTVLTPRLNNEIFYWISYILVIYIIVYNQWDSSNKDSNYM